LIIKAVLLLADESKGRRAYLDKQICERRELGKLMLVAEQITPWCVEEILKTCTRKGVDVGH